jgi:hypothetical protein
MEEKLMWVFFSIVIGVVLVLIIRDIIRRYRKNKSPNIIPEEDFIEISSFNVDNYVDETFRSAFHSIQFDEWSYSFTYDKISFTKKRKRDSNYRDSEVEITFIYEFKDMSSKKKKFTFKKVEMKDDSSYTTYTFNVDDLSSDIRSFVYKVYSQEINSKNNKEKAKVDLALSNIKSIIGKASDRDEKLDKLLGIK